MVELREIKGYDGFKLQGIFYSALSLYALKNLQASPKQFLEDFRKNYWLWLTKKNYTWNIKD